MHQRHHSSVVTIQFPSRHAGRETPDAEARVTSIAGTA